MQGGTLSIILRGVVAARCEPQYKMLKADDEADLKRSAQAFHDPSCGSGAL